MDIHKIKFNYKPPSADRRHFLDEEDIKIVLQRLPEDLYSRLRVVHFTDDSEGGRTYGYTTTHGRKEISICAQPPRISLTRIVGQSSLSHSKFGAVGGSQWPSLAIRRYLLYNTFLHEIGHLQIINENIIDDDRRKFASEGKAQQFANQWRKKLYAKKFDHPDPVHNAPTKEELEQVREFWVNAHSQYKTGLKLTGLGKHDDAVFHYEAAIRIWPNHSYALEALGVYNYYHMENSIRAMGLLEKACQEDPTLVDANLFLGLSYAEQDHKEKALFHFDKAIKLMTYKAPTQSVLGRVYADWNDFETSRKIFKKLSKKNLNDPLVLFNYKQYLIHPENPDREINLKKHSDILNTKDLNVTSDRIYQNSRGIGVNFRYNIQ